MSGLGQKQRSGAAPSSDVRAVRIAVWFWGTGGAGIRLADRFAAVLSDLLSPERVLVLGHADNALLGAARARGNAVASVAGAAGHRSKAALAFEALPRALRLWRSLGDWRPDAVIIPMNFALAWPFVLMAAARGIPYAYTVHDVTPHPGDFAPGWQVSTQRALVARARCVIVPSAYSAATLRSGLQPAVSPRVLPLAALVPPRRTGARPAPTRPIRFLFLGRLIEYKGLKLLADAFRTLGDRSDWRLTVAGTGPEQGKLKAYFAGLGQVDLSQVRLLPEEAIEQLVSAHHVLVCPYLEASQSGVIGEAGADAMPSVVTPVGALPEQIGHGRFGWIARSTGVADLAAVLRQILDEPETIGVKSQALADLAGADEARHAMAGILQALLGPAGATPDR